MKLLCSLSALRAAVPALADPSPAYLVKDINTVTTPGLDFVGEIGELGETVIFSGARSSASSCGTATAPTPERCA